MTKFALEFLKDYIPQKSALKAMKEGKRQLTLKELETEVMSNNWEEVYKKVKEKEEVIASLEGEKTKLQSIVEMCIRDSDWGVGKIFSCQWFINSVG